ncbi:hypothetical protein B0A55_05666 [Friedmanniomyces simplex]|uniref:Uncharacterized protein n=1 Tax=Friedmanniomyces simplex TaxID=329884 RepID=A0A4U0XHI1_9PEZI|nr:hypothetical protein B0A55_05666 [Friedmanniomyces simplex]
MTSYDCPLLATARSMSYAFAPPRPTEEAHWGEEEDQVPPKPLSGPGTSRQTRRLQLRNAGFRAAAVPTRKVTPKSISSSTNWSSVSGIVSGSDAENCSPSGTQVSSVKVDKRRVSGVLQEIGSGSATLTRPEKSRPRVSSARLFGPMAGSDDAVYTEDPMSPPPPRNTIRAKSIRSRAKVNKTRRSMSGEAREYIDHLEAELASTQSQLQAINSPSVTRQQSSKLRTLNTETKQLQDELAEWEARYEQRVQEIVDEHVEIEASLRSELRRMEQDAEEAKYRIEEMSIEVTEARQNMEAVEAANVNLERRLEIMSEILATSPSKIDLHATPGMGRKHQRPKSMLPRFPTASSLVASPERQPKTQPPSPLLTFADPPLEALETSFSQSEMLSDAESVFSEAPSAGGSLTSLEPSDTMPNFNPWTLHAVQSARVRPARRMRRFGPGSHGPKPLILPSTSHYEYMPGSAPPLERSETTPAFSFPFTTEDLLEEEDSPSSLVMRRRASTTADETTLANLAASPFAAASLAGRGGEAMEESLLGTEYPMSAESQATNRDVSSLGSVAGRNLMDELCAVRTQGTPGVGEEPPKLSEELSGQEFNTEEAGEDTLLLHGKEALDGPDLHSALDTEDAVVSSSSRSDMAGTTTKPRETPAYSSSIWTRFHYLFGDLWRSPVAMAQHLILQAQLRMQIPEPLRNVQWWLVGVLLGPMAKRRFLATPASYRAGSELERQPLLRAYSAPAEAGGGLAEEEEDGLVYGTMYHTPPGLPARAAGGGEKGKGKQVRREGCPYHHRRSRHSPWVWIKFSITLAVAVGVAFKDGPASLLRSTVCGCRRKERRVEGDDEGSGRVGRTSLA